MKFNINEITLLQSEILFLFSRHTFIAFNSAEMLFYQNKNGNL